MHRAVGTRRDGSRFDEATKVAVWNKGAVVPGSSPDKYRRDACGRLIEWSQYGVTNPGGTGWEIDHVLPVSKGGTDDLDNLQPLQWENNRAKGDDWPHWSCAA